MRNGLKCLILNRPRQGHYLLFLEHDCLQYDLLSFRPLLLANMIAAFQSSVSLSDIGYYVPFLLGFLSICDGNTFRNNILQSSFEIE